MVAILGVINPSVAIGASSRLHERHTDFVEMTAPLCHASTVGGGCGFDVDEGAMHLLGILGVSHVVSIFGY